jgi:hypothetical protein
MRGAAFAASAGFFLGAAGSFVSSMTKEDRTMYWEDEDGRRFRIKYLEDVAHLDVRDPLYAVFQHRIFSEEAYGDAVRNLQNVLILYHRFKRRSNPQLSTVARTLEFTIKTSRALDALHVATLGADSFSAERVEEAVGTLRESMDSIVYEMRRGSEKSLPDFRD